VQAISSVQLIRNKQLSLKATLSCKEVGRYSKMVLGFVGTAIRGEREEEEGYMTYQRGASTVARLFVVAALAIFVLGFSPSTNLVRRLCVVAVHDSSLFTLCPPSLRRALADGGLKSLPPTAVWYTNANRFVLNGYEMRINWDGRLWVTVHPPTPPAAGGKAPEGLGGGSGRPQ